MLDVIGRLLVGAFYTGGFGSFLWLVFAGVWPDDQAVSAAWGYGVAAVIVSMVGAIDYWIDHSAEPKFRQKK